MRGVSSIIEEVVDMINDRLHITIDGVVAFNTELMDVPLSTPTVAVGLDSVNMKADKLSVFSGRSGTDQRFSVPAEIVLSLDIYIPREYNGIICYDVLSYLADKFLKCTTLTIESIECDRIKYDNTFMCMILPARVKVFDRVGGDTEGTM